MTRQISVVREQSKELISYLAVSARHRVNAWNLDIDPDVDQKMIRSRLMNDWFSAAFRGMIWAATGANSSF